MLTGSVKPISIEVPSSVDTYMLISFVIVSTNPKVSLFRPRPVLTVT